MSLETLANLAELIGAATVVGGILFAMIQLREFRQQRNQSAAVELMRAIQDRGFVAATTRLSHVPDARVHGVVAVARRAARAARHPARG